MAKTDLSSANISLSTSDIIIRPATEKDVPEMHAIYSHYIENTAVTFEYKAPGEDEFARRLRSVEKKLPYLAAVENGEICGYTYAAPFNERAAYDWSIESSIYIKSDKRRQGVGCMLYSQLEKCLAAQGVLNIYACVAYPQVEDEFLTLDSVIFHEKMGYKTVGHLRRCGFKFGRWYDIIWMEKIIGEHNSPQPPIRTFDEVRGTMKQ